MAENTENDAELEDWNPEQSPAMKVMRESKTYAAYKMNCDLRGLPEMGKLLFGFTKEMEKTF